MHVEVAAHVGELHQGGERRLLRVRRGLQRLAGSDEHIRQIGFQLEYEHPAQFDRDFMEVTGLSPKEFRTRVRR